MMEWLLSMKRLDIDGLDNDGIREIFGAIDEDNDGLIEKQDFILFAASKF